MDCKILYEFYKLKDVNRKNRTRWRKKKLKFLKELKLTFKIFED